MSMQQTMPTAIRRSAVDGPRAIEIDWSDGATSRHTARDLREACPCATCREKRGAARPAVLLEVLRPEELAPLTVTGMQPVGQYAYSIAFSDGHDTGIYTLDYLRELAMPDRRPTDASTEARTPRR